MNAQKVEGKDRNCDGDCIENDLKRVGEEWKNYRREWRLLTKNLKREK